jgi:hypothetical protein
MPSLASLVWSTVAFFLASFFLNRYLQQMGIPKGMTRSLVVFSVALAVAYGVAALIDWAFA